MLYRLVLVTAILSIAGGDYFVRYQKNKEAIKMKWLTNTWNKPIAGLFNPIHRKPKLSYRNHLIKAVFMNSKEYLSDRKYKPDGYVRLL